MALVRTVYQCVAFGHEGQWQAICLDLDIAVQDRSLAAVQADLEQSILAYIREAFAEPEPVRSQLLRRRAPLRVRALWAWRLFRAQLAGRRTTKFYRKRWLQ